MRTPNISKKSVVCGLQSAVSPPRSSVFSLQSAVSPRAGFTLLELMTVMVIMFILMGMSTLALRGVMRGVGISGAVANVRSVITQARQQAIMHQRPTAVVFYSAGTTNTMQILTSYGRVLAGSSGFFEPVVELPWPAGELSGAEVFNFEGDKGAFTGGSGDEYYTSGIAWQANDDIAFQIGSIRPLPESIAFEDLPNPPVAVVVFEPDGSARDALSIVVREINAPPGTDGVAVEVDQPTGWIQVVEPGELP